MWANYDVFDLTYDLEEDIPTWGGSCGFSYVNKKDHAEHGLRAQSIRMHGGIGTHIDAPLHFVPDGQDVSSIPIQDLMAPTYIIDVRPKVHPDYQITVDDVKAFEKHHGPISQGGFVIGQTGWGQYWKTDKFRNADSEGVMHFPTFSSEAAEYLMEKRVLGIGIDTLSPDPDGSDFPVHKIILVEGKYIVENLKLPNNLPSVGLQVMIFPLKGKGLAEAPVRCIALKEKD